LNRLSEPTEAGNQIFQDYYDSTVLRFKEMDVLAALMSMWSASEADCDPGLKSPLPELNTTTVVPTGRPWTEAVEN
jgi:hypothetical protein